MDERKSSVKRRVYTQRRRGEATEATRRRIVEATVRLHVTRGPARTTIAEIAREAGVQRLTVYRHFPSLAELFGACQAEGARRYPVPDLEPCLEIQSPTRRATAVLEACYEYFAARETAMEVILRDAAVLAAELAVGRRFFEFMDHAAAVAASGWELGGERQRRLLRLFRHATDFWTWRSLRRERGLSQREAVEAMLAMAGSGLSR